MFYPDKAGHVGTRPRRLSVHLSGVLRGRSAYQVSAAAYMKNPKTSIAQILVGSAPRYINGFENVAGISREDTQLASRLHQLSQVCSFLRLTSFHFSI